MREAHTEACDEVTTLSRSRNPDRVGLHCGYTIATKSSA